MDNDLEADFERLPTIAFGREFTHIPEHVRQNLDTLDRESAIYSDQWIEEIGDFRHLRIRFTDDERAEFARRFWAFELFIRAGHRKWARTTPESEPDIAADADTYSPHARDGTVIPPPYHCFAAFLGDHLEALTCGMVKERLEVIELKGKAALLFEVRRVIESLTPTIRSFNAREKGLIPWTIPRG